MTLTLEPTYYFYKLPLDLDTIYLMLGFQDMSQVHYNVSDPINKLRALTFKHSGHMDNQLLFAFYIHEAVGNNYAFFTK